MGELNRLFNKCPHVEAGPLSPYWKWLNAYLIQQTFTEYYVLGFCYVLGMQSQSSWSQGTYIVVRDITQLA